MAYSKFIIPKEKPTHAASFISPDPTLFDKTAGHENITNPATKPITEYKIEHSGNPSNPIIFGMLKTTLIIKSDNNKSFGIIL